VPHYRAAPKPRDAARARKTRRFAVVLESKISKRSHLLQITWISERTRSLRRHALFGFHVNYGRDCVVHFTWSECATETAARLERIEVSLKSLRPRAQRTRETTASIGEVLYGHRRIKRRHLKIEGKRRDVASLQLMLVGQCRRQSRAPSAERRCFVDRRPPHASLPIGAERSTGGNRVTRRTFDHTADSGQASMRYCHVRNRTPRS
jgi:hypothetical protein